jgi:hypothetical protein
MTNKNPEIFENLIVQNDEEKMDSKSQYLTELNRTEPEKLIPSAMVIKHYLFVF